MTIYYHKTGPLMRYERGMLVIEDLNPTIKTQWRLSRWELVKIGLNFIRAALGGGV